MGLFGFFMMIMFMEFFFSGDFMLLAFGFVLPLLMISAVVFGMIKLIQFIAGVDSTSNKNIRHSNVKKETSNSYVKNSKNAKIDRVLSEYFRNNVALIIFDDISISTQGGKYTTVDNLYISYRGEKICQMKEFKTYYPEGYDKIISALGELAKRGGVAKEEPKKEEKKETVNQNLSKADRFIDNINNLNKDIFNEEITNGLYQTCDLLKQIDIVDSEDGKEDAKLNKLYEYYLPILTGILEDYKRLSSSPVKGEEFKKCETQLIKTIKLINEALKTIYNSLHEADYMNLNADINTLQSLLKQDGLVDTPFKEGK